MKKNAKKDLHAKEAGELKEKLSHLYEEIRVMRLDHTMGKLKNISSIGNKREEIAVVKTILREKILSEKPVITEAVNKPEIQKDKNDKKTEKKVTKSSSAKAQEDKGGDK